MHKTSLSGIKKGYRSIVSPNIRIRSDKHFFIGDYSIVDDFSYFSTKVRIGKCSHIASGCCIGGGIDHQFELGDYSSLSSGVKIWCKSDDYVNDIVIVVPRELIGSDRRIKNHIISGDVIMGRYTGVGANTVIMPDNVIPDGTVIGALSFVPPKFKFKPWSVYAGVPIRLLGKRNKKNVLKQKDIVEKYFSEAKKAETK